MTPRQTRFVQEYLIDPNGTQAAILAGYAEKSAHVQASRLLIIDKIAEAVSAGQAKAAQDAEITLGWLIQEQRKVYEAAHHGVVARDRYGKATGTPVPQLAAANKALENLARFTGHWIEQRDVTIRSIEHMSETELESELAKADGELAKMAVAGKA